MERIVCTAIGYMFGLIQTGYIYGRLHHVDIRAMGSGNAGSTNALRTMGLKAGAVTFFGDAFKCIFAVLTVKILFAATHADILPLLKMYAGLGVIFGHNFPFYLQFKGGKGIAATAGLLASTLNFGLVVVCFLAFVIPVLITRYVSLGSLIVATTYLLCVIGYGQMGGFGVTQPVLNEMYIIVSGLTILAFIRHRANIKRLLAGTESKIGAGKNK